jgi:hypothetical protein
MPTVFSTPSGPSNTSCCSTHDTFCSAYMECSLQLLTLQFAAHVCLQHTPYTRRYKRRDVPRRKFLQTHAIYIVWPTVQTQTSKIKLKSKTMPSPSTNHSTSSVSRLGNCVFLRYGPKIKSVFVLKRVSFRNTQIRAISLTCNVFNAGYTHGNAGISDSSKSE